VGFINAALTKFINLLNLSAVSSLSGFFFTPHKEKGCFWSRFFACDFIHLCNSRHFRTKPSGWLSHGFDPCIALEFNHPCNSRHSVESLLAESLGFYLRP